jgi:hypothetical protein
VERNRRPINSRSNPPPLLNDNHTGVLGLEHVAETKARHLRAIGAFPLNPAQQAQAKSHAPVEPLGSGTVIMSPVSGRLWARPAEWRQRWRRRRRRTRWWWRRRRRRPWRRRPWRHSNRAGRWWHALPDARSPASRAVQEAGRRAAAQCRRAKRRRQHREVNRPGSSSSSSAAAG